MITNLWALLSVMLIVAIIGIIGLYCPNISKKTERKIEKWLDKMQPYITAGIGITVTLIIGIAVAIPIFEMFRYDYICENNNWTGIHTTDDKQYWLFGEKITVLCIDDRTQNSTITNEIKVIRWSESLFNPAIY